MAGYLLRILQEHRLPESYVLQLYQQPFFFLLAALAVIVILGHQAEILVVRGLELIGLRGFLFFLLVGLLLHFHHFNGENKS